MYSSIDECSPLTIRRVRPTPNVCTARKTGSTPVNAILDTPEMGRVVCWMTGVPPVPVQAPRLLPFGSKAWLTTHGSPETSHRNFTSTTTATSSHKDSTQGDTEPPIPTEATETSTTTSLSITTPTSSQKDSTQRDAETPTPTEGMETSTMTSSTTTTATSSQEGYMQGDAETPTPTTPGRNASKTMPSSIVPGL